MRDNIEIHEQVRYELCDCNHGSCGRECVILCDGYRETYDEIEAEWWIEDNPNRIIRLIKTVWEMITATAKNWRR